MAISWETVEELLADQGHRSKIVSAGRLEEFPAKAAERKT